MQPAGVDTMNPGASLPGVAWACFLDDVEWPLGHARIYERLSAPYRIEVELELSQTADLDAVLGGRLRLRWSRADHQRELEGVVLSVQALGATRDGMVVRIHAGPPLAEAALGRRSQVFQQLDTTQIARRV